MKLRNKKTGKVISKNYPEKFVINNNGTIYLYDTLAELNEEWEDYKPKEPLIKDEKIRRAIRAYGWSPLTFHRHPRKGYSTFNICNDYICFNKMFMTLEDGEHYTIAELCGEEEE